MSKEDNKSGKMSDTKVSTNCAPIPSGNHNQKTVKKLKQIEFPIEYMFYDSKNTTINGFRDVTEEVDGKMVESKEPVEVSIMKIKTWAFETTKKIDDTPENRRIIEKVKALKNIHEDHGYNEFSYMDEAQFEEIYEIPAEFFPCVTQEERRKARLEIPKEGWKVRMVHFSVDTKVIKK